MEPRSRVAVGVNARIVSAEGFHLVEAVLDRVGLRLVAQMPFTREVRRVAILLEEFGNRRCLLSQGRSRRLGATTIDSAERMGMRPVMKEARPAVQLACPYQHVNIGAFLGDPINVRGRMAECSSAVVAAEVVPAGVVRSSA